MNERMRKAIEGIINPGKGTITMHIPMGKTRAEITPHGHVVARKDGLLIRCGGPAICAHCAEEKRFKDAGTWPCDPDDNE